MRKATGDQFRESLFAEGSIAENLPGLFPVEEWRAFFFTMDREGNLREEHATLHLPAGLGDVTPSIKIGRGGAVEHVRRWGVALRGGMFERLGFDLTPLLTHDATRFASDDAEALHLMTLLTHFDLPGYFILASDEHPFLLFDPEGELKGSDTRWFTYAGALAYLVSDGSVQVSFDLVWQKDRQLYGKVMQWLNQELAQKKSKG